MKVWGFSYLFLRIERSPRDDNMISYLRASLWKYKSEHSFSENQMKFWKLKRTALLKDQKLISTTKTWCLHGSTQHAAKIIYEASVTWGCQAAQIFKNNICLGGQGSSGQEKALVTLTPLYYILKKKKRSVSQELLLFAKLSQIVDNWCFLKKITMEKDQIPLTMKLDIAHRKRREVKVNSDRGPKTKGFSLAAANLIVGMGCTGAGRRQWGWGW